MPLANRRRVPAATPNINVTPLIDVLLVLLIIFMVASPLRPARFKALVPEEPRRDAPEVINPNDLTLVVTIDHERKLSLNKMRNLGTLEEIEGLLAELARVLREREERRVPRLGVPDPAALPQGERYEKTVFIKAPRAIRYGEGARVIDKIKGAGANPVGLQIDDLQ